MLYNDILYYYNLPMTTEIPLVKGVKPYFAYFNNPFVRWASGNFDNQTDCRVISSFINIRDFAEPFYCFSSMTQDDGDNYYGSILIDYDVEVPGLEEESILDEEASYDFIYDAIVNEIRDIAPIKKCENDEMVVDLGKFDFLPKYESANTIYKMVYDNPQGAEIAVSNYNLYPALPSGVKYFFDHSSYKYSPTIKTHPGGYSISVLTTLSSARNTGYENAQLTVSGSGVAMPIMSSIDMHLSGSLNLGLALSGSPGDSAETPSILQDSPGYPFYNNGFIYADDIWALNDIVNASTDFSAFVAYLPHYGPNNKPPGPHYVVGSGYDYGFLNALLSPSGRFYTIEDNNLVFGERYNPYNNGVVEEGMWDIEHEHTSTGGDPEKTKLTRMCRTIAFEYNEDFVLVPVIGPWYPIDEDCYMYTTNINSTTTMNYIWTLKPDVTFASPVNYEGSTTTETVEPWNKYIPYGIFYGEDNEYGDEAFPLYLGGVSITETIERFGEAITYSTISEGAHEEEVELGASYEEEHVREDFHEDWEKRHPNYDLSSSSGSTWVTRSREEVYGNIGDTYYLTIYGPNDPAEYFVKYTDLPGNVIYDGKIRESFFGTKTVSDDYWVANRQIFDFSKFNEVGVPNSLHAFGLRQLMDGEELWLVQHEINDECIDKIIKDGSDSSSNNFVKIGVDTHMIKEWKLNTIDIGAKDIESESDLLSKYPNISDAIMNNLYQVPLSNSWVESSEKVMDVGLKDFINAAMGEASGLDSITGSGVASKVNKFGKVTKNLHYFDTWALGVDGEELISEVARFAELPLEPLKGYHVAEGQIDYTSYVYSEPRLLTTYLPDEYNAIDARDFRVTLCLMRINLFDENDDKIIDSYKNYPGDYNPGLYNYAKVDMNSIPTNETKYELVRLDSEGNSAEQSPGDAAHPLYNATYPEDLEPVKMPKPSLILLERRKIINTLWAGDKIRYKEDPENNSAPSDADKYIGNKIVGSKIVLVNDTPFVGKYFIGMYRHAGSYGSNAEGFCIVDREGSPIGLDRSLYSVWSDETKSVLGYIHMNDFLPGYEADEEYYEAADKEWEDFYKPDGG